MFTDTSADITRWALSAKSCKPSAPCSSNYRPCRINPLMETHRNRLPHPTRLSLRPPFRIALLLPTPPPTPPPPHFSSQPDREQTRYLRSNLSVNVWGVLCCVCVTLRPKCIINKPIRVSISNMINAWHRTYISNLFQSFAACAVPIAKAGRMTVSVVLWYCSSLGTCSANFKWSVLCCSSPQLLPHTHTHTQRPAIQRQQQYYTITLFVSRSTKDGRIFKYRS